MYIENNKNIENKTEQTKSKKSFLEKLGQANPWNIFWIMYFGLAIVEVVCSMVVKLAELLG